jgi:hypothetical protein
MNREIGSLKIANNPATRNYLRGIARESKPGKIKKVLDRIQVKCGDDELRRAILIINSNPLFENNGICREFNKSFPVGLRNTVIFRVEEIVERLNASSNKLYSILTYHHEAQTKIHQEDYEGALAIFKKSINSYGVSCYLYRSIIYLQNRTAANDDREYFKSEIEEIFRQTALDRFRFISNVVKELNNVSSDYFNIYRKLIAMDITEPFEHIVSSYLDHITTDRELHLARLSSFYSISLIDALLYILNTNKYSNIFEEAVRQIPKVLLDRYSQIAILRTNLNQFTKLESEYEFSTSLFREAYLLIEQNDIHRYKTVHGSLYNPMPEKYVERSSYEKRLIREYFESVSSLKDLDRETKTRVNFSKFCVAENNTLERSNALLYFIENQDGLIGEEKEFVSLMSKTCDIGEICPSSYLYKIKQNAHSYDMSLVMACLVSISDNTRAADHELRKTLQDIAVNNFNKSLKELLEHLFDISPAVTGHLVNLCDQTFLIKLFHLIPSPNKALEVRADILEWYGEKTSDSVYLDRAKNHRIDVQINKEKGTIDDSRIYVDPMKFTQWIEDHILPELVVYLYLQSEYTPVTSVSISWGSVNSGISHQDQAASLLLRCYEEFCNNQIFGVASYLGRRIRHGTFKGTALKEVEQIFHNDEFSEIKNDKEFQDEFKAWLESYRDVLEAIKSEELYFCSKKKPNGMLHSNFNTPRKVQQANRMFMDVLNTFARNEDQTGIPHLIAEYCWQIIEEDLSEIRKRLESLKRHCATLKIENQRLTKHQFKSVTGFCNEVNAVTSEKMRIISEWFRRPSTASASADLVLLFRAVVSEAKEQNEYFDPQLKLPSNTWDIRGGRYHAIYDALYILIVNVARHGKPDGRLEFQVEDSDPDEIKLIVISELKDGDDEAYVRGQINDKLSAGYDDANTIDKNSGIKKLKQLTQDIYIRNIVYDVGNRGIKASIGVAMGR